KHVGDWEEEDIVEVKQNELMKNRSKEDHAKLTGIAFGPSYQPANIINVDDEEEEDDDEEEKAEDKLRSRNLVSERNRRKRLNEQLCILGSQVSHVTKMNKRMILSDAISYLNGILEETAKSLTSKTTYRDTESDDVSLTITHCGICYADVAWAKNIPRNTIYQGYSSARSLDFIIDTASGDHSFDPYMTLLKPNGVLVLVGFPSEVKFNPMSLLAGSRVIFGSAAGGTKDMQEMLDFCAANNIYPEVEVILIQYMNEAFEMMENRDVKYNSLK
ncbi:hypothetical protein GIB67_024267, partial [Kingdonia uniflora]